MPAANPFLAPVPPAPPPLPPRPAPFGRRAAALALDHLALLVCLVPAFVYLQVHALSQAAAGAVDSAPGAIDPFERVGPIILVSFCLGACVQLGLLALRGRTIGKLILGLPIVRPDGRRAGALRLLFVRTPLQVLGLVPGIGAPLLLVNLVLALRPPHRALHDRLANTHVVDTRS